MKVFMKAKGKATEIMARAASGFAVLFFALVVSIAALAQERGGQLIISSHVPEVWARYEAIGHRVLLGQPATPALASTANPEPNA